MANISGRITRKSLSAKKKAAIKTIKTQAKEKIREVKMEYAQNPERAKAKAAEKQYKKELRIQKANARVAYNSKQLRPYSLGEELFNSISHGIGAGLSVAAIILLAVRSVTHAPVNVDKSLCVVSFVLFGATLFISYLMSTLYHAIPSKVSRSFFSVLTHVSIYLLIAATYTPFVMTRISGNTGLIITGLIWGVCIFLAFMYFALGARMRAFSVFSYILLGWLIISIFSFYPVGQTLSVLCKRMILFGGIVYSAGIVFFLMDKFKWSHSIFHLFTLAGSILHFFAIYYSI